MDSKREKERKNILNKVQEQIERVSIEIEKLQQDLNFYRRLYQELRRDYSHYRCDSKESEGLSIEFISDQKISTDVRIYKQKPRKQKKNERKEAFETAKGWHLDRIREKEDKDNRNMALKENNKNASNTNPSKEYQGGAKKFLGGNTSPTGRT
jgi:hypothetical protein